MNFTSPTATLDTRPLTLRRRSSARTHLASAIGIVSALVFLAACGSSTGGTTSGTGGSGTTGGGGDTTTTTTTTTTSTTTTTTGAGGSAAAHPLEEGDYQIELDSVDNDTCGTLSDNLVFGTITVLWTSDTVFTLLEDGGADPPPACTLDGKGGATCTPFSYAAAVSPKAEVQIENAGATASILSPKSFKLSDPNKFASCTGSDCALLESDYGFMFPCGITYNVALTLIE